jgi:ankyrin repeat protein
MRDAWTPPNADYPPPKPSEPPLFRAAREGDHDEIRRLIAADEDPNAVFDIALDPHSRHASATPLMVAAGSGDGADVDTVRLLIALGADPRLAFGRRSAATLAVRGLGWNYRPGGDAARLRELVSAGSPIVFTGVPGAKLLSAAARTGDPERLRLLLEYGVRADPCFDPDRARRELERGRRAFSEPASTQPADGTLRDLSEADARLTCAPWASEIPLFAAAMSGSPECASVLLDAGAAPCVHDNMGRTAMHYAAREPVVALLRRGGLAIEHRDWEGLTPLALAVRGGVDGRPRVRALMTVGADVNAADDRGRSVLMLAVSVLRPDLAAIRELIGAGANPLALANDGRGLFHAAVAVFRRPDAEREVRAVLRYLHDLGVDIKHRDARGRTPLALAIAEGAAFEVRLLCDLGADPNAPVSVHRCAEDSCGMAEELPLLAAVESPAHPDQKVEALLLAGADPFAKDVDGRTVLHRAIYGICAGSKDPHDMHLLFFALLPNAYVDKPIPVPTDRDGYVRHVAQPIDRVIRRFVKESLEWPEHRLCDEWECQRLVAIRHLAAHEHWWRTQRGRC